jgi:hypothetical protein
MLAHSSYLILYINDSLFVVGELKLLLSSPLLNENIKQTRNDRRQKKDEVDMFKLG